MSVDDEIDPPIFASVMCLKSESRFFFSWLLSASSLNILDVYLYSRSIFIIL